VFVGFTIMLAKTKVTLILESEMPHADNVFVALESADKENEVIWYRNPTVVVPYKNGELKLELRFNVHRIDIYVNKNIVFENVMPSSAMFVSRTRDILDKLSVQGYVTSHFEYAYTMWSDKKCRDTLIGEFSLKGPLPATMLRYVNGGQVADLEGFYIRYGG